jgi:superfamily II DNA or RNA helicase
MAIKYYGLMEHNKDKNQWELQEVAPHVCIKLKSIFPRIPKTATSPFYFQHTPENCHDLLWFLARYPLAIPAIDLPKLHEGKARHLSSIQKLEEIMLPGYQPPPVQLKGGFKPRDYQLKAAAFDALQKRFLLGDDLGLGKTLEAIIALMNPAKLPAAVCVQTHLPKQWKEEGIEKFSNLRAHIIKGTKPYDLPAADVYIFKYSCLAGWVDVFTTGFFKSATFDECQDLRRCESDRYSAAKALSESVDYCMGMSATPIYNFGDEIFNVLNLIKPGCLGDRWDFLREWAVPHGQHHRVTDPIALGSYLRDSHLFLRRTRADVGRELPPINKVIHTIGYDSGEVKKSQEIARQLAMKVMQGSFMERGQAARELDSLLRHETGVSKAREVAAFVRILLENGEPVVLAGWHRDVYDIWMAELAEFRPVMYTGSESGTQKQLAKDAFIAGETDLFIISLRSGIGLDGLQHRCRTVVLGELDWSPKVHDQLIGRVDRDGQPEQVTAYFLVSEYGSDPPIIDVLGLKSSQAHGIVDPLTAIADQYSDESRIKKLAESFLNNKL